MGKTRPMIVDDEVDLLAELKPLMERSGYEVLSAVNGEQALEIAAAEKPDLIVLDMLMPRLDGRAVLRRTQHGSAPLSSFRYLVSGALTLDRKFRQVHLAGEELTLTSRAVGVLEFLMLSPHEMILRERLLEEVWGWSATLETRRSRSPRSSASSNVSTKR